MKRELLFVASLATGALLVEHRPAAAQTPAGTAAPARPDVAAAKGEGSDATATAEQPPAAETPPRGEGTLSQTPGAKALGISILGNQEAPTSLVIVPWKSSELGSSPGVSTVLDDSKQPVDRDVFMRSLRYYEISAGATRQEGAKPGSGVNPTVGSDASQSTTATPRRK
jgi:hypothetical protein